MATTKTGTTSLTPGMVLALRMAQKPGCQLRSDWSGARITWIGTDNRLERETVRQATWDKLLAAGYVACSELLQGRSYSLYHVTDEGRAALSAFDQKEEARMARKSKSEQPVEAPVTPEAPKSTSEPTPEAEDAPVAAQTSEVAPWESPTLAHEGPAIRQATGTVTLAEGERLVWVTLGGGEHLFYRDFGNKGVAEGARDRLTRLYGIQVDMRQARDKRFRLVATSAPQFPQGV